MNLYNNGMNGNNNNGMSGNNNNGMSGNNNNGMSGNNNNGMSGNNNNGMNSNYNNGMNSNYNNGMNSNYNNGMNSNYNNGMNSNYNNGMNSNYNNGMNSNYNNNAYAGIWKRLLANIIDYAIYIIMVVAFAMVIAFIIPRNILNIDKAANFISICSIIIWIIYVSYQTASNNHATLGKKAMEIVVINKDGSYLTFGQMVLRETLKFCFSGFFIISIIMMIFTEKKQSIHDLILNQTVIKK